MAMKGGDKMQKVLERMGTNMKKGNFVKVGFLRGSTYPDGTPVAMIGLIQDFGAPAAGIPPRPFFRNAVKENKNEWPATLSATLVKVDYDGQKALAAMGAAIQGQIQESIVDGRYKPLKQATARRKGFATPLIDTGVMLKSVKYEVVG